MASSFFSKLDSRHTTFLSATVAIISVAILPSWLHVPTRILCVWNFGCGCFLTLTWAMMVKADPVKMHRRAQRQYEGRLAVFTIIIAAACASVLAIGFILADKRNTSPSMLILHVMLSFFTIVDSWLLVHTIFTIQYAHLYYQDSNTSNNNEKAGGLDFPTEDEPDYWDFLYFSFVIGMTSQVSDVQVTSRQMRRLTLMHGILSFFFNTTILAMGINIIASAI